jgi:hypothetical protein
MLPTTPRIGQLIRLLASDKDGEVVAAARALGRTLKGIDQDFHDLAASVENATPHAQPSTRSDVDPDCRALIDWLSRNSARLSAKEQQFIRSMSAWRGKPTTRQGTWLRTLFEREHGGRR